MNRRKLIHGIAGIALLLGGAALIRMQPYRTHSVLASANRCPMSVDVVEPSSGEAQGFVVLLHGISATKRIMWYVAQGFANQNLRVFVPDLPGHGRTPGPFTTARAEECTEALVQELMQRRAIVLEKTILAGHSMGGAIAVRVGSRIPVAGVIAISPAPMQRAHGVHPEMLLFQNPGPLPEHFLVIDGSLEPQSMRANAADLVASRKDAAKYIEIRGATHSSLLFNRPVVRTFQDWTSQTLHLTGAPGAPSLQPVYGALAGFLGLLLLANPFLRELTQKKQSGEGVETGTSVPWGRMVAEFATAAMLAVLLLLRLSNPLRIVHLYQGDYFASFLLILGTVLALLHWKFLRQQLSRWKSGLLGACFGALILFLLFTAWFELSLYEAWLTPAKWFRFPLLFVALLPYHFTEEICLGPAAGKSAARRLAAGLALRLVVWGALALGVFYLRSGEILMVLLGPYFALLFALQRRGMDIVRQETGSAAAAAVFGAILLAGFCLVIFPVT